MHAAGIEEPCHRETPWAGPGKPRYPWNPGSQCARVPPEGSQGIEEHGNVPTEQSMPGAWGPDEQHPNPTRNHPLPGHVSGCLLVQKHSKIGDDDQMEKLGEGAGRLHPHLEATRTAWRHQPETRCPHKRGQPLAVGCVSCRSPNCTTPHQNTLGSQGQADLRVVASTHSVPCAGPSSGSDPKRVPPTNAVEWKGDIHWKSGAQ